LRIIQALIGVDREPVVGRGRGGLWYNYTVIGIIIITIIIIIIVVIIVMGRRSVRGCRVMCGGSRWCGEGAQSPIVWWGGRSKWVVN